MTLVSEATELETGSSDEITVTATVRDDNNNVVTGEQVSFAGIGDITISPNEDGITQDSGRASAGVRAGADNPSNRNVEVKATDSEGRSASLDLSITGTELGIDGPSSVPIGQEVDYEIRLQDGSGSNIADERVTIDVSEGLAIEDPGASGGSVEKTTDVDGRVELAVSGVAGGEDRATIVAETPDIESNAGAKEVSIPSEGLSFLSPEAGSLLPVNDDQEVVVLWEANGSGADGRSVKFTASRGTIEGQDGGPVQATTDGSGEASVTINGSEGGPVLVEAEGTASDGETTLETSRTFNYVGTVPGELSLESNPATVAPEEETTLLVRLTDTDGNPVAEEEIVFTTLVDETNGANFSSNTATTDARGVATTRLTAGDSDPGNQNDIKVEAEVVSDDSVNDDTRITVTGETFSITFGTGNEIEQPDSTTYRQPWTVFVNDSSGNAAANEEVTINVEPIGYRKGGWFAGDDGWFTFGGLQVGELQADGSIINVRPVDPGDDNLQLDDDEVIAGIASPQRCISRDIDPGDPILDGVTIMSGADEGVTQPDDVTSTADGRLTTDDEGRADFALVYPESEAPWVTFRIEATIETDNRVDQTVRTKARDLAVLASDVEDTDSSPPGGTTVGSYGTAQDCTKRE